MADRAEFTPPPRSRSIRRDVRHLVILGAVLALLSLSSGLMRKAGAPARFDLSDPATYAIDLDRNPYRALWSPRAVYTGDFRPILEAARARLEDPTASIYRASELDENSAAFVYTPVAAMAVLPLARADLELQEAADVVHRIHLGLWLLGGLGLGYLLRHRDGAGARWRAPTALVVFAAHFAVFYPFAKAVQLTQAGLWIWFGTVAAAVLLQLGRPVAAGVALGLGVSIKPHMILVLALLAATRSGPRPFLVSGSLTVAVCGLASLAYAGWDNCIEYVTDTLPHLSAGYAYYPNQSLNGLLLRAIGAEDPAVFDLAAKRPAVQFASSAFALVVLALTFAVLWRRRRARAGSAPDRAESLEALALTLTAAVIASPVCWIHHFVLLSLPLVILARGLPAGGAARRGALVFAAVMLVGWHFDARFLRGLPASPFGSLGFLGALLTYSLQVAPTAAPPGRAAHP